MQAKKDAYSELKRSDNVIPDYEKTRAFSKLIKLNAKSIFLTTLIYFIQAMPVWLIPLVTAYIINITTETVNAGTGATADVWRKLIIATIILIVSIVLMVIFFIIKKIRRK